MFYISYILTFGSFFLIKYFLTERKIKSTKEIVLLFLFPMAGYGNWIYNRKCRELDDVFLPRKWYIWKKMVFQNFLLILLFGLSSCVFLVITLYYSLLDDEAVKVSSGTFAFFQNNVDPTLGIGLVFGIISVIVFTVSLLFFLVIIPAIIANSIKRSYSKK